MKPSLLKTGPAGLGCSVQLDFEHLKEQGHQNLPRQPVPIFGHLSEEKFSWYPLELNSLQFLSSACYSINVHLCEQYKHVFSISFHQLISSRTNSTLPHGKVIGSWICSVRKQFLPVFRNLWDCLCPAMFPIPVVKVNHESRGLQTTPFFTLQLLTD